MIYLPVRRPPRNLQSPLPTPWPRFESASWLYVIDGYLRGAESPHPPQLPVHSPTGFIRGYTRTAANLFYQRFIRWFRFTSHPRQGLAQAAATHLQSEGMLEHGGRLAVGQS